MTLTGAAPPLSAASAEEAADAAAGARTTVGRRAAPVLAASAALVTYAFLDALSKPSPLSTASPGDLVPAVAYAVLLAAGIATLGLVPATGIDLLVRRLWPRSTGAGTVAVTAALAACTVLTFLENALYTSLGTGLKTEDGPLLRTAFGLLAVTTGTLAARRLVRCSHRSARRVLGAAAMLVALASVVVAVHLATQEEPAPLRAVEGGPHLYDVLVLSSDGIDADRMSVYGYRRETTPFLDAKSSEFRVFENAFTNNGNTTGSITALMTGASPLETGVVYPPDTLQHGDALETLPRLLGEQGYHRSNWAVPHYAEGRDQNLVDAYDVDNGHHPGGSPLSLLPLGVGPGRWFVHETVDGTVGLVADVLGIRELTNPYSQVSEIVGDTISDADRLQAVLAGVGGERPSFVHTHLMGTHGPTFRLADPHYSRGQEQTEGWQRDFYDDSLRQFDGYIHDVYAELERTGRLDRTVLVVTSDHGIRYDATKRIPLLIRFPDGAGAGRVTTNVQRIDVAPTILETLGFEQPGWMTGSSLVDADRLPVDRQIVATTTATREFPNHFGFRPEDGDLLVTYIRCGTYVTVQPSGESVEGEVLGSTSTCDERPVPGAGW